MECTKHFVLLTKYTNYVNKNGTTINGLCCVFRTYRNAEPNLKSTKNHIKPSDCQLDPPVRDLSGTFKPNPANDSHRETRPQFMDPLDDDKDPDVIPNQYGEWKTFLSFTKCYY